MKNLISTIVSLTLTICLLLTSYSLVIEAKTDFKINNFKSYSVKTGIKLKWDENPLADKYIVYTKNNAGLWGVLDDTSKTSIVDSTINEGVVREYKIEGVNELEAIHSEPSYSTYCYLKIPTISKVTNTYKGLKIEWSSNKFATEYIIMKKIGVDGKWKKLKTINNKTFTYTDEKVTNGVKYFYSLRKKYKNYNSMYSLSGVEKTRINCVKNFNVKNSPKGIKLTWSKSTDVKNYLVHRKVVGEKKWTKIATLKSTKCSYIDKKPKYGKKNTYAVQIITKNNLKSGYSQNKYVYAVNPKKPMIALTYDDGPADSSTNTILDTLKKNNARATFFVLGSRIASYKDSIQREAKLGCEIACHTYSHITLTSASDKKIKSEISKTNELIKKYTNQEVKLARAPGGSHNERVRNAVGLPMIGWSIDTRDWEHRNSSKSYNCVVNNAKDGDIILMHDIHSPTATASQSIIPYLTKKGYQLVTVSEMFDAKGITLKSNGYYYSAR